MAISATGRGTYIGFEAEATYGTAETIDGSSNWRPLVSGSLQTRVQRQAVPDLYDGGTVSRRKHDVSSESGGALRLVVTYDNIGLLLKAALGSLSDGGGGGPTYTHDYTLANALPSLTMELIRGNSTNSETFEGIQINTATFGIETGQVMFLDLDLVAEASAARGAAGSPAVGATETVVLHSHAGQLSFDGNSYDLISFRVVLNNNLERRPKLGSLNTQEPNRGGYSTISIEATVEAVSNQNDTLLAAQLAGTEGDVAITFTSGTRTMTFTGHNAYLNEASDPVGGAGIIRQRLRWMCQSDGTDLGLKIAVVNETSSGTAN